MELAIVMVATATNPNVGDLMLSDSGEEVIIVDLPSEVAQRLFVALNFFAGEWKRDLLSGTPYYQLLLKKAPSDRLIRAIFTQIILGTEGVSSLTSFAHSLGRDRRLTLTFTARLADGSTFRSTDYPPLRVVL